MTQLREKTSTGAGKTTTVLVICESQSPSGDAHVLVVHNVAGDKKPEGWGFPGGGRREGELLVRTAVRELQEETGVRLAEMPKLELLKESRVSPSHSRVVFKLHGWLPFMEGNFLVDDPGKGVVEACWVSYHEIDIAWQAMQNGQPALDSEGRRYYASHLRLLYE